MSAHEKSGGSSPLRSSLSSSSTSALSSPPRQFSSPRRGSDVYSDRFIPSRAGSQLDNAMNLLSQAQETHPEGQVNSVMNNMIRSELLGHDFDGEMRNGLAPSQSRSANLFRYKSSEDSYGSGVSSNSSSPSASQYARAHSLPAMSPSARVSYDSPSSTSGRSRRKISRVPYKVLDAPSLQDDFYLNLIDWSDSNVLAVGLSSAVYLWSAYTSKVTQLNDFARSEDNGIGGDSVTSVSWMSGGTHLAVGMNSGGIQIWDATKCEKVREMHPHSSRVGALAWQPHTSVLASGSRDRQILIQDTRVRGPSTSDGSPYRSLASGTPPRSSSNSRVSHLRTPSSRSSYQASVYHSPQRVMENEQSGVRHSESPSASTTVLGEHSMGDMFRDAAMLDDRRRHTLSPQPSRNGIPPRPPYSLASRLDGVETRVRDGGMGDEWERYGTSVLDAESDDSDSVPGSSHDIVNFETDSVAQTIDSRNWLSEDSPSECGVKASCAPPYSVNEDSREYDHIAAESEEKKRANGSLDNSDGSDFSISRSYIPPKNGSNSPDIATSSQSECVIKSFGAHKQEVCGLKWSFDEKQLASGGNDNKLYVWNMAGTGPDDCSRRSGVISPEHKFTDHTAAVKAIAWSPHQSGLLASGGGTADRNIRFWNTHSGTPLQAIDTGSQVCNLMWSAQLNEIVSTHGYSLNQIAIWKYPSMQKLVTLTGHTFRVLYLAMSPDGQSIVTGAGDETLRFWNVFPATKNYLGGRMIGSKGFMLPGSGDNIR